MRTSAFSTSSSLRNGRASKSHSQDWSSVGDAPSTSTSTPQRRAAIVAFQMRGFGRYEKMRRSLTIGPPCFRARPARTLPSLGERAHLDVERPCRAFLVGDVPCLLRDRRWLNEECVSRRLENH